MPYFDAQETATLLQQYARSYPNQRRTYAQAEAFVTRLEATMVEAECIKLCAQGQMEIRADDEALRLHFVSRDEQGQEGTIDSIEIERRVPRRQMRMILHGAPLVATAYGLGIITGVLCATLIFG